MVRQPISLEKLKLYGWHKEWGIVILLLVCLRLLWRITHIEPLLPQTLPAWQKSIARAVHIAVYGCMFVMPLTGWMMSSAAGLSVSFFGLWTLPNLVSADENIRMLLQSIHAWLAYFFIALITLHTAAALKHHFIEKNDILRRMLP